jgi:hypothetical protein
MLALANEFDGSFSLIASYGAFVIYLFIVCFLEHSLF